MAVKPLYLCNGCNQWCQLPAARTETINHGLFVATHYPQAFQQKLRWCRHCVQLGLFQEPVVDPARLPPSIPIVIPLRLSPRERTHMLWLRFSRWLERFR